MQKNERKPILVTCLCVTYNHEKYIREALESFISQKTDFAYEILIHDDASTDKNVDIIKEYELKYPEIIKPIYQKENQFSKRIDIVSTYMLPKARGKYIAMCEGDDYWTDPYKLQKQVDILEKSKNYIACVHQTIVLDGEAGSERLYSKYNSDCEVDLETVISHWGEAFHTSSLMRRKEYCFGMPEDFFIRKFEVGDFPTAIYLLLQGKVFYINASMSVYRKNNSEQSWTCQMTSRGGESERLRDLREEEIKMLKAADKYSQYKYHNIFQMGILKRKFVLQGSRIEKGFWKDSYQKEIFKKLSLARKCRVMIRLYMPKLYNILHFFIHFENR